MSKVRAEGLRELIGELLEILDGNEEIERAERAERAELPRAALEQIAASAAACRRADAYERREREIRIAAEVIRQDRDAAERGS